MPGEEAGLVANDTDIEEVLIQTITCNYPAYTRLAMTADFRSWLNPFYNADNEPCYATQGEYGLKLAVSVAPKLVASSDAESGSEMATYEFYINSADMNGNPYDFQSYYTQEKMFDISDLGTITGMKLSFYQKPDTFKDEKGNKMPFLDFLGNKINPNLFVKNAYISLGYDANDFDKEMIQIYTLDSTSYIRENKPTEQVKKVQLRWIHKQNDGTFKSITLSDDLDYQIKWYRYELGHASADKYSDVYWKFLSTQERDTETGEWKYEIKDEDWVEYNIKYTEFNRFPDFFTTWLIPDSGRSTEKVKAILIYQGEVYRSNILTYYNDKDANNIEVLDSLYGLNINCEDGTYGNYRIYKLGGGLLDSAQAHLPRKFKPLFKSVKAEINAEATEATEAESITWIIPKVNTMISINENDFAGKDKEYELFDNTNNQYYIITRYADSQGLITDRNTQTYYIKSYYNQNYNNNTVQCKMVKNGTTYIATKELTFGPSGSSGTDFTLILDFDNGITAMTDTDDDRSNAVTVTARLYDYENNEVDISHKIINWGWKTDNHLFEIVNQDTNHSPTCEIIFKDGVTINNSNYSILQAKLTDWGDYDLIAYLPIPLKSDAKYTMISGTTQVIYNSDGCLTDYFKNPFRLWGEVEKPVLDEEGKDTGKTITDFGYIDNVKWDIENAAGDNEKVYTPKIKDNEQDSTQYLQPLSFYVQNACENVSVIAELDGKVIWRQPILIMLNRYPAAMLNEWDGELEIDTDNGNIKAPRLVAGKKNNDNTFSGVVLGDGKGIAKDVDGSLNKIGLFGYSQGKQSFGFMEDGTAFIGKSSGGRIQFDGTKATIQSPGFETSDTGMQLDLDDGKITAYQFTLNAGKSTKAKGEAGQNNNIYLSTEAKNYPLQIGSNFKVAWDGSIIANAGTFTGDITGASGTFSGGLNVANKFLVNSSTGDVTIGGNLTFSGSGTITWGNNKDWYSKEETDNAISNAIDELDLDLPNYIKDTYIDSTTILSPDIYAGKFYATGQGRRDEAAFYIYDGIKITEDNKGKKTVSLEAADKKGYLSYDKSGSGSDAEASERVFLTSLSNVALKIQSGLNLSMEANGRIYILSPLQCQDSFIAGSSKVWGPTFPANAVYGQIFFKTSS